MADNVALIIPLGGCTLVFNGVDMGKVNAKGVTVEVKTDVVKAFTADSGTAAVAAFEKGKQVTIKAAVSQADLANIESKVYPGMTLVTGGGTKITYGQTAGTPITGVPLALASRIAANTPGFDSTFRKVVPVGVMKLGYHAEGYQEYEVEFDALWDDAGPAGGKIGSHGQDSATSDATAPAITAGTGVVPNDDAAATAAANIVWTINNGKALDLATVVAGVNVIVEQWSGAIGSTATLVAGTVVVDNVAHTITWTPAVALTRAGTIYTATLLNVKGQNGVLLNNGLYQSDFTNN